MNSPRVTTAFRLAGALCLLLLAAPLSSRPEPPDEPGKPERADRSRKKVGRFQTEGLVVEIAAHYREEEGGIGGPKGPRRITIVTYGAFVHVSAQEGYALARGGEVVFNARVTTLRSAARPGRGAAQGAFFQRAAPVRTHGLDLTARDFRKPIWIRGQVRGPDGRVQPVSLELIIAAVPDDRHRLDLTTAKRPR